MPLSAHTFSTVTDLKAKTEVSSQGHQVTIFHQATPIGSKRSGHDRHNRCHRVHCDNGTKHLLAASLASKSAYNAHWCSSESAVARDVPSGDARIRFAKSNRTSMFEGWGRGRQAQRGWIEPHTRCISGRCLSYIVPDFRKLDFGSD